MAKSMVMPGWILHSNQAHLPPGDLLQSTNFCASASLQGRVSRQLGSAPKRMSVFTWQGVFVNMFFNLLLKMLLPGIVPSGND